MQKQVSWVWGRRVSPDPLVNQKVERVNPGLHWSHSAAPQCWSDKHKYNEDSPLTWRQHNAPGLTPRWRQTWLDNLTMGKPDKEVKRSIRSHKDNCSEWWLKNIIPSAFRWLKVSFSFVVQFILHSNCFFFSKSKSIYLFIFYRFCLNYPAKDLLIWGKSSANGQTFTWLKAL